MTELKTELKPELKSSSSDNSTLTSTSEVNKVPDGHGKFVEYFKMPRVIPSPSHRFKPYGGTNKNRPVYVKYHNNGEEFDIVDLNKLKESILSTKEKFVHPLVYVNFAKTYKPSLEKIKFTPHRLFKLRIWSNQLRDCQKKQMTDRLDYITYLIASKIIKYAEQ